MLQSPSSVSKLTTKHKHLVLSLLFSVRPDPHNGRSTFKGKIELKKYSREEYTSMSMAQHQQLYELQKNARLIKGKKAPRKKRPIEARVAILEKKRQ